MVYDITSSNSAYEWVLQVLGITGEEFIEKYIVDFQKDAEEFMEHYFEKIEAININELEIVVLHVTSNSDECRAIRKSGICDLKKVLSESSELKSFLEEKDVLFDIENKKMMLDGQEYSIDYDAYCRAEDKLNYRDEKLKDIGRKIYFDYQINGFLFTRDVKDYGTDIHEMPEILLTISQFNSSAAEKVKMWKNTREGYVIRYKAKFMQFAHYTFYDKVESYLNDSYCGWIKFKKWLVSHAIDSSFSDLHSDIYAYMKSGTIIEPGQILECIPVDEWKWVG